MQSTVPAHATPVGGDHPRARALRASLFGPGLVSYLALAPGGQASPRRADHDGRFAGHGGRQGAARYLYQ